MSERPWVQLCSLRTVFNITLAVMLKEHGLGVASVR